MMQKLFDHLLDKYRLDKVLGRTIQQGSSTPEDMSQISRWLQSSIEHLSKLLIPKLFSSLLQCCKVDLAGT